MKPDIKDALSIYQIGGVSGHRPQEFLFVVMSVLQLYMMLGMAVIISCWDIKKYFDKEVLRDGMDALYKAKVNRKLYKLWFNLNEKTRIQVQTAVGLTEEKDTGETLGQGSLGGAIVSSVNLSQSFE